MQNIFKVIVAAAIFGACLSGCDKPLEQSGTAFHEEAVASETAISMEVSSSEAVVVSPLPQAVVSREAADFIKAVKAEDPARLHRYFPADYPERELTPDAPDMLFARKVLRPIIANGAMDAREVAREGHKFSILFYLKPFENRLKDKAYLESDYLKTFFVCNFDDAAGRWILSGPIMCYDETEGPYESEPDV